MSNSQGVDTSTAQSEMAEFEYVPEAQRDHFSLCQILDSQMIGSLGCLVTTVICRLCHVMDGRSETSQISIFERQGNHLAGNLDSFNSFWYPLLHHQEMMHVVQRVFPCFFDGCLSCVER